MFKILWDGLLDVEESFSNGIDITVIDILKPYSEVPLYETENVF